MENDPKQELSVVYKTLSEPAKKLLITMTHFSHENGGTLAAIVASSGLNDTEVRKYLSELKLNALVQRGNMQTVTDKRGFVQSEDGAMARLPKDIRVSVLRDVLHFSETEIENMLDPLQAMKRTNK